MSYIYFFLIIFIPLYALLVERDGNPFEFSIYEFEGRRAIDLGVYGAPETFFIDKNGLIRERHVGVIDEKVWEEKFSKYLNE